jgi:dihydroorotase-like cyclic amidohydrolase
MLGLEHAASLTYEAMGAQNCEPTQFFNLLSRAPARIAQLRAGDSRMKLSGHGGALHVGEDANLVIFDPHARWTVRRDEMRSRSTNTPYDGRAMLGRVRTTLARGALVVDDGALA